MLPEPVEEHLHAILHGQAPVGALRVEQALEEQAEGQGDDDHGRRVGVDRAQRALGDASADDRRW